MYGHLCERLGRRRLGEKHGGAARDAGGRETEPTPIRKDGG
jgi:hypothetical protein